MNGVSVRESGSCQTLRRSLCAVPFVVVIVAARAFLTPLVKQSFSINIISFLLTVNAHMLRHTNGEIGSTSPRSCLTCLRVSRFFLEGDLSGMPARGGEEGDGKSQKNRWNGETNEARILSLGEEIMFRLFSRAPHTSHALSSPLSGRKAIATAKTETFSIIIL